MVTAGIISVCSIPRAQIPFSARAEGENTSCCEVRQLVAAGDSSLPGDGEVPGGTSWKSLRLSSEGQSSGMGSEICSCGPWSWLPPGTKPQASTTSVRWLNTGGIESWVPKPGFCSRTHSSSRPHGPRGKSLFPSPSQSIFPSSQGSEACRGACAAATIHLQWMDELWEGQCWPILLEHKHQTPGNSLTCSRSDGPSQERLNVLHGFRTLLSFPAR